MKLRLPLCPGLLSLLAAARALAVTDTWDGGGADNNIATSLNWLDNTAPLSDVVNTDLIFAGVTRPLPNFASVLSAHSVTFNNTAGMFVVGGQSLTIGTGGVVNNDTDHQTFSNLVAVGGATASLNAASGGLTFLNLFNTLNNAVTLDGPGAFSFLSIGGTGSVTKNGAGVMSYSPAASPQTLDLIINTGPVNTMPDGTTDTFFGAGTIAVNGTGVLNLGENFILDGVPLNVGSTADLNLASGKTLTVRNGGDVNIAGGNFSLNTPAVVNITDPSSTFAHNGAAGSGFLDFEQVDLRVSANGAINSTPKIFIGLGSGTTVLVNGASLTAGVNDPAPSGLGGGSGPTRLTFTNSATGNFGPLIIGSGTNPGNVTLLVESGADVTTKGVWMGPSTTPQNATATVTGPGSTLTLSGASEFFVGADNTSTGTLNVTDGGTVSTGTGSVEILATGTVNLDGGTLNINGPLTKDGEFNFTAGTLNLLTGGLSVSQHGLLGANLTLDSNRIVNVTGSTTIGPSCTLTLNGGTLRTSSLLNSGTFDFQKGTLGLNAFGFVIGAGALGPNVVLRTGARLEFTGSVPVDGLLRVDGGSFSTTGNLFNNGTIDLRDGSINYSGGNFTNFSTGRLFVGGSFPGGAITNEGTITLQNVLGTIEDPGTITNTGLINGDGTIRTAVANNAGGQIRGEAGKTLSFTGSMGTNAGMIVLQGGTLASAQPVSNGAAGQINGHGELYFPATPVPTTGSPTAGFNNNGRVNFAGGNTLVFGTSQMNAGSHLITSGGAVVTFFDVFRHSGAEVKASAGSALVFFGEVRGAGSFTGSGTVYMEGGYSPGASPASVTIAPQMVFTESNVLTMEIGGAAPGTQHDKLTFTNVSAPQVTWGGALTVTLIDGFTPAASSVFDLFDFDNVRDTGAFAAINLPALPGGLVWDTSQLYIDGTLRVQPPGLTFTQWATTVLGNPAATPNGDHDNDGFDNGTEFALGLFPPQAGTILPGGGFFTYNDGQRLRVLFTRPLDRTGLTLKVQASSDLVNWFDLAVSLNSDPFTGPGFVSENRAHPVSDPGLVEVRDILTSSAAPRRQIRINITLAP